MTYGDEIEPLGETATKLGASLRRPLIDIVHDYSGALPITAAHVVQTGKRTCRFYWVSGSSLVVLETQEPEHEEVGFVVKATGNVRQIKSAVLNVETTAVKDRSGFEDWALARTVRLGFDDDPEPTVLPDPLSLPLDTEDKRRQVKNFLDAVLQAYTA